MNFATLQGLSIPEGAVTEIKDSLGRVIWAAETFEVVLDLGDMNFKKVWGMVAPQVTVSVSLELSDINAVKIGNEIIPLPYTSVKSETLLHWANYPHDSLMPTAEGEYSVSFSISTKLVTVYSFVELGVCHVALGKV